MSDHGIDEDWLEFDGDEVYLTEDAPEEIVDYFESNQRLFELVINYNLVLQAAGYDEHDRPDLIHADRVAESEYQKVDAAIDRGDIEAAQEHKKWAALCEKYRREYTEWLYNDR